jgi:hypothetical protein
VISLHDKGQGEAGPGKHRGGYLDYEKHGLGPLVILGVCVCKGKYQSCGEVLAWDNGQSATGLTLCENHGTQIIPCSCLFFRLSAFAGLQ